MELLEFVKIVIQTVLLAKKKQNLTVLLVKLIQEMENYLSYLKMG